MADFPAKIQEGPTVLASPFPGRVANIYKRADLSQPTAVVDDPLALDPTNDFGLNAHNIVSNKLAISTTDFPAGVEFQTTPAVDWFEDFHVLPRSLTFGNILSLQQTTFEVYNSHRYTSHDWDDFINNAGAGVVMNGIPPLPFTFGPQSSGGLSLSLEVSTSGPPLVNSTLDFVFDLPATITVPITLQRVVLFNVQPELPYDETLEWLTDVLPKKDGKEQRKSVRKNPRQFFEWDFVLLDGTERSDLMNTIFEWQSKIWGIPVWHETTFTTTPISVSDLTFTVQSTAFADYRVGEFVLIYENSSKFDVLTLGSTTVTTITVTSGTLNSYSAGVFILPLRTGYMTKELAGGRFPSGDATLRIRFRVDQNDTSIASTAAFPTFNSKVLLDDDNFISQTMQEGFEHNFALIDSLTGTSFQSDIWPTNKRGHMKTFLTNSRQTLFETRQLLHSLRGRQISFYLPTHTKDLVPDADLVSGSAELRIEHASYDQFVDARAGRNVIRVEFNNGDSPLLRTVLSSVVNTPTRETLTLDGTWPSTVTPSEVEKISYVEKVRWDSDTIRLRHELGDRTTRISGPVKVVLE